MSMKQKYTKNQDDDVIVLSDDDTTIKSYPIAPTNGKSSIKDYFKTKTDQVEVAHKALSNNNDNYTDNFDKGYDKSKDNGSLLLDNIKQEESEFIYYSEEINSTLIGSSSEDEEINSNKIDQVDHNVYKSSKYSSSTTNNAKNPYTNDDDFEDDIDDDSDDDIKLIWDNKKLLEKIDGSLKQIDFSSVDDDDDADLASLDLTKYKSNIDSKIKKEQTDDNNEISPIVIGETNNRKQSAVPTNKPQVDSPIVLESKSTNRQISQQKSLEFKKNILQPDLNDSSSSEDVEIFDYVKKAEEAYKSKIQIMANADHNYAISVNKKSNNELIEIDSVDVSKVFKKVTSNDLNIQNTKETHKQATPAKETKKISIESDDDDNNKIEQKATKFKSLKRLRIPSDSSDDDISYPKRANSPFSDEPNEINHMEEKSSNNNRKMILLDAPNEKSLKASTSYSSNSSYVRKLMSHCDSNSPKSSSNHQIVSNNNKPQKSLVKQPAKKTINIDENDDDDDNLNSVDVAKKRALEKLSNSNKQISVSRVIIPAQSALKSLKCKENATLLANKNKQALKFTETISLTQSIQIAKAENAERIKRMKMSEENNKQTTVVPSPFSASLTGPSSTTVATSSTIPQTSSTTSSSSKLAPKETTDSSSSNQPVNKPKFVPTFRKPVNENDHKNVTTKNDASNKLKETNKEGDKLTSILETMNVNNVNKNGADLRTNEQITYHFEDFLFRLLKCNYNWLIEQDTFNQPPPVVTDAELKNMGPVVDSYHSYKDYYNTMFPLLLSEAWQEITKQWKDQKNTQEKKLYQNMPIWLKEIKKHDSHKELVVLSCQFLLDLNSKFMAPYEDDLLKLSINVDDPVKKVVTPLNFFGIVTKCSRLKGDEKQIKQVKDYVLKHNSDKTAPTNYTNQSPLKNNHSVNSNFQTYEVTILARFRRYAIQFGQTLDYELLTNMSSTLRRAHALYNFQSCPLQKTILRISNSDPAFWPNQSYFNKCGKEEFKFDCVNKYNDSQQKVIVEASSLIMSRSPKLYFIQGPPGTGKSHTIVGIVNAMLARRKILQKQDKEAANYNLKFLICSPSNGGCDEIGRKLKMEKQSIEKNMPLYHSKTELSIVRIGRNESMHQDHDDIFMEKLMKKKLEELIIKKHCEKSTSLMDQFKTIEDTERKLRKSIKFLETSSDHQKDLEKMKSQLKELLEKKKNFELSLKKTGNHGDINANRAEYKKLEPKAREMVLKEADIIICTLNYSGNQHLDCLMPHKNNGKILVDVIIIDEAAQCLELESLMPLRFGCQKIIQVGDPEQLPATVLSKLAQDHGMAKSFFERAYERFKFESDERNPIKMLSIQYRMHTEICLFPSELFYKGELTTSNDTHTQRLSFSIAPYIIFDIRNSQEVGSETNESIYNPNEAEIILKNCLGLKKSKINLNSVGIITPYQGQLKYLKDLFRKNDLGSIEIGTVDSYQGREKDIILLSTVRANNNSNTIGFLSYRQRLNVMLTRAKYALYIFCHLKSLIVNSDWRKCIENGEKRNVVMTV